MLRYGQDYVDIGEQAYELQFHTRRFKAIKDAAKSLGYLLVPNDTGGADCVSFRSAPAAGVFSAGPLPYGSLHGAKSDRLLRSSHCHEALVRPLCHRP